MVSDRVFSKRFNMHLRAIDSELKKGFSSAVPMMDDIGMHALLGEGKRLRPLFFVLSSRLCGYKGEDVYLYSTIFEYLHCASLLHDDVIDNAELRRNKPSARSLWGNSAAVLTGDYLTSRAMATALKTGNIGFLEALVNTGGHMSEGQFLELVHTRDCKTSKDQYMEIIISKTAVLMSAACACGGIIGNAGAGEIERLKGFGLNLGIAFQMIDDLLDYLSSEKELGKPSGKDLKEGKTTLPLIYALSELGPGGAKRVERLFSNPVPDEEDYSELLMKVRNSSAIEKVREEAKGYVDKASGFLSAFPESSLKEDLLFLNDYITSRRY